MWERVWRKVNPLTLFVEWKLTQLLWRTVQRFLKKLKAEITDDPEILFLGTYPEKTVIPKDTCASVLTGALFTTARTWKQLKCASTEAWIWNMWCVCTVEYYSAIKRQDPVICRDRAGPRDGHTE